LNAKNLLFVEGSVKEIEKIFIKEDWYSNS
jgi:hypothetical protein